MTFEEFNRLMLSKPKTYRSKKYLEWIRNQPCIECGNSPCDAHHVRRLEFGGGISLKPPDYVCLPLCREHHNTAKEVEKHIGVYIEIIRHLMRYLDEKEGK